MGRKKAKVDEFPMCAHMVSDEYEQLSSEGEASSYNTVVHILYFSILHKTISNLYSLSFSRLICYVSSS